MRRDIYKNVKYDLLIGRDVDPFIFEQTSFFLLPLPGTFIFSDHLNKSLFIIMIILSSILVLSWVMAVILLMFPQLMNPVMGIKDDIIYIFKNKEVIKYKLKPLYTFELINGCLIIYFKEEMLSIPLRSVYICDVTQNKLFQILNNYKIDEIKYDEIEVFEI